MNASDALRELEATYGTAALADAVNELRHDRGFMSRRLAADPRRHTAGILAMLPAEPDSWAARLVSTVQGAAHTARPYPGTAEDAAAVTR